MSRRPRARVTSKGQVTIPKPIRDALGIEPSSYLEFELTEGGAILRPAGEGFLALRGTVKPPPGVVVDWRRERELTREAVARRAIERAQ